MSSSIYLAIPLMAILVIAQATIWPHFPLFGLVPQLYLLAALAWALLHGLREGIFWAFVAGILIDLFSASPMGVTSLALMVAVAVATLIQQNFPESRILMPVVLAAVATIVFWFIYLLLLRLLLPLIISNLPFLASAVLASSGRVPGLMDNLVGSYALNRPTLTFILRMSLVHSLLILPVYWSFYTLERFIRPKRVEM